MSPVGDISMHKKFSLISTALISSFLFALLCRVSPGRNLSLCEQLINKLILIFNFINQNVIFSVFDMISRIFLLILFVYGLSLLEKIIVCWYEVRGRFIWRNRNVMHNAEALVLLLLGYLWLWQYTFELCYQIRLLQVLF